VSDLNLLFHGFAVVLTPFNILLMFIGIVLGVIIGVLPGLGAANGIAILLPLTFTMRYPRSLSTLKGLVRRRDRSILFNIRRALVGGDYLRRLRWRRRGAPARRGGVVHLVVHRRIRRRADHLLAPLIARFALSSARRSSFRFIC
jgi:hypothetical protein